MKSDNEIKLSKIVNKNVFGLTYLSILLHRKFAF